MDNDPIIHQKTAEDAYKDAYKDEAEIWDDQGMPSGWWILPAATVGAALIFTSITLWMIFNV